MVRKLKKQLTFKDLFAISTGTMISSGFFLLPGIAFAISGPAVILAFFIAGLLTVPAMLSKAELATAMPKAGGVYFYLDRSMGPLAGTIGGLGAWFSLVLKGGFALIGFSVYVTYLMGWGDSYLVKTSLAIGACTVLTLLNLRGAKASGRIQWILVVIVLMALSLFVGFGNSQVQSSNFTPFMPNGWDSLIATIGMVFISYAGLTKVASVAEEVKDPDKNIPKAMMYSLFVVMLVYILGVTTIVGVLPADKLAGNERAISTAAYHTMGYGLYLAVSLAAILAFISCANAAIMSASRFPFAMARDQLIPHVFVRVGKNYTPYISIFLTSGTIVFFLIIFDVKEVAKLASSFKLLLFAFCNLAVIFMRESEIEDYNPSFRSPFYPYIQIFGILSSLFIISQLGIIEIFFCLGVIVFSSLWYLFYGSHRVDREGAFRLVLDRMKSTDGSEFNPALIQELRQIQKDKGLKEKDEDPFVNIVKNAPVFDIEKKENFQNFFVRVGQHFEETLNIHGTDLTQTFLFQNKLGNTPVEAGIAIPHHRMEELDEIHLVLGRCCHGLKIPESKDPIYCIFVILGSRDLSSLHLRVLSELAVRTEQPDFMEQWISAETEEEAHHILLEQPSLPPISLSSKPEEDEV